MQGYGVFWSIVEDLYNNANALRTDYEGIAYDLRTDSDLVASVVNDFNLFVFDGEYFGSNSVQERLDQRNDKSEKARKSASYRWENANALQPQSDSNAKKERKGKEIKGKETIIPPIEEFLSFCKQDMQDNGLSYSDYEYSLKSKYDSWVQNKWKDGHNKQIKNWKSKIRNTIPFLSAIKPSSKQSSNNYQSQVEAARKAFKPLIN
jgi:hypothetical protein